MKYILGIDIGTTNTKALAYTSQGSVIAHANVGYSFKPEKEGYHEIDPQTLFDAVVKVIGDAVQAAKGHEIGGISFSAAMHGIMAVDDTGTPLTNMITWADLRSNAYVEKLKDTPAGRKIYERTGTPIHPMSPLCKLMWMKDHQPGIFKKAFRFISIKEFVFYRFFGVYVIDHSIASATGLFDIHTIDWNADALNEAGITAERLSKHVPVTYVISGLKDPYPSMLGIAAQTPFVIGGSDGCLAQLGSNALSKDDVSLTIGTSGAVRMMTSQPVYDRQQRIFNYLLTDDTHVAGGPVNNGGNVLQWFIRNMAGREGNSTEDYNWFVDQASKIPPGSGGLVFLPYIYGERAPVWDADARGLFYGINGTHTQAHFMRAILEGLAFALNGILATLEEIVGPAGNLYISGGFTHSAAWVKVMADVLGKKLQVVGGEDASSAGAAIIGMKALNWIGTIADAASFFTVEKTFEPDMEAHKLYKENYAIYSQLYDKLKDLKK